MKGTIDTHTACIHDMPRALCVTYMMCHVHVRHVMRCVTSAAAAAAAVGTEAASSALGTRQHNLRDSYETSQMVRVLHIVTLAQMLSRSVTPHSPSCNNFESPIH